MRRKKDSRGSTGRLSVSVGRDLALEVRKIAKERGISVSRLLDRVLVSYLEDLKQRREDE